MIGFNHLPSAKIRKENNEISKTDEELYYDQQKLNNEKNIGSLGNNIRGVGGFTSDKFSEWFNKSSPSDDPNINSKRASISTYNTSYPISVNLNDYCILTFYDYDRFVSRNNKEEQITLNIQLPLPLNTPDNIQTNNNTTDLGISGNITYDNFNSLVKSSGSGNEMGNNLSSGMAKLTENIQQSGAKNAMKVGAALIASKFSDGGAKAAAQSHTGLILNPHTTAMFDGVALRSFNLDWRLSPKTKEESDRLNEIITCIKLRSLPGELASGLSLNYPDTVQVSFEGKVKNYLPIYQRSFLTSINITPDSNGGIILYNSGAPVTYNLQLGFVELSINTRSTIKDQMVDLVRTQLGDWGESN